MVEKRDVYDQVWSPFGRTPRHMERFLEGLFERGGKTYALPAQIVQLRQDFDRFLRREMPYTVRLLKKDRELVSRDPSQGRAHETKPGPKRRVADPETKVNRRSVLVFVIRHAVSVDSWLRGKLTVSRRIRNPYPALAHAWKQSHPHTALTPDSLKTICCDARKDKEFTRSILARFQREFDGVHESFQEDPPAHDYLQWLGATLSEGYPSACYVDYQFAIHRAVRAYVLSHTPDGLPGARHLRAVGSRCLRKPLMPFPHMPGSPVYAEALAQFDHIENQGEPVSAVVIHFPDGTERVIPVGYPESDSSAAHQ